MSTTIYVPLLNEGTDVWRPVEATRLAEDLYLILGVVPEDETWAFPPGSTVRCEVRSAEGEVGHLVAMALNE